MLISSIEVTNNCNLRCNNCLIGKEPKQYGDGVDYPKGFLTVEHLCKALKVSTEEVCLSIHGEPLLHPDLCGFITLAKQFGKKPSFHTNAVLLSDKLCDEVVVSNPSRVQVSLHSELSLINFKKLVDRDSEIDISASILYCNKHKLKNWIDRNKLEEKHLSKIHIAPEHNWALNEPNDNNYASTCQFIIGDTCSMKWDGTIVSCCFDFECINRIGHIDNFSSLNHKSSYELCKRCSPAWTNQHNNIYWTYPQYLQII
jgi:organic radical activating enzyme